MIPARPSTCSQFAERECVGAGVGIKNHAIHPDISGDRNAGLIGKRKGRDIVTCVRHRGRRPVGSGVSIAADRIHAPSGAVGVDGVQRTERNVTTVAQDRMGDFMAAIMPMAPFKRKADSPPPCTSRVDSPAAFDTGVFPVDNSASRRCEMQCALFLNV